MKHRLTRVLALRALGGACREEGAVEKAGRKLDEAVDKLQHPARGRREARPQADEALDDAKEAAERRGRRQARPAREASTSLQRASPATT